MKTILLTLLFPIILFGQVQIGEDINGGTRDLSGFSVSLSSDGNIMAIAAISTGTRPYTSIYENVGGVWTQIGNNINGLGTSVSLSDDGMTVAIGAKSTNDLKGSVGVYENLSGIWTQIGSDIVGEAVEDSSGTSISLSGDATTVAIGAPENDGNGFRAGHVRIYENVSGVWTQIGDDIDGEAGFDESGTSVSISTDGSIVAIGAPDNEVNDGVNRTFPGHVRVYENADGVWTQIGEDIDGDTTGDQFGKSVSLSSDGTILAIGGDGNNGSRGFVKIYKYTSGIWTQLGEDIVGEAAIDQSGFSVSLSSDGNVVVIGAPGNDDNGDQSGHVRIYENITGAWTQVGEDIDGRAAGSQFGRSVSISDNGTIVAIGGPFNSGNGDFSGYTSVYDVSRTLSATDFSLENTIVVYPSPASKTITIQLNQNSILEKTIIYNSLGQIVKEDTDTTIDVNTLNSGTYYAKITTNNGIATKKIIIE